MRQIRLRSYVWLFFIQETALVITKLPDLCNCIFPSSTVASLRRASCRELQRVLRTRVRRTDRQGLLHGEEIHLRVCRLLGQVSLVDWHVSSPTELQNFTAGRVVANCNSRQTPDSEQNKQSNYWRNWTDQCRQHTRHSPLRWLRWWRGQWPSKFYGSESTDVF